MNEVRLGDFFKVTAKVLFRSYFKKLNIWLLIGGALIVSPHTFAGLKNWNDLPPEIVLEILRKGTLDMFPIAAQVSRTWSAAAQDTQEYKAYRLLLRLIDSPGSRLGDCYHQLRFFDLVEDFLETQAQIKVSLGKSTVIYVQLKHEVEKRKIKRAFEFYFGPLSTIRPLLKLAENFRLSASGQEQLFQFALKLRVAEDRFLFFRALAKNRSLDFKIQELLFQEVKTNTSSPQGRRDLAELLEALLVANPNVGVVHQMNYFHSINSVTYFSKKQELIRNFIQRPHLSSEVQTAIFSEFLPHLESLLMAVNPGAIPEVIPQALIQFNKSLASNSSLSADFQSRIYETAVGGTLSMEDQWDLLVTLARSASSQEIQDKIWKLKEMSWQQNRQVEFLRHFAENQHLAGTAQKELLVEVNRLPSLEDQFSIYQEMSLNPKLREEIEKRLFETDAGQEEIRVHLNQEQMIQTLVALVRNLNTSKKTLERISALRPEIRNPLHRTKIEDSLLLHPRLSRVQFLSLLLSISAHPRATDLDSTYLPEWVEFRKILFQN